MNSARELLEYLRGQRLAVQASVHSGGGPQAAAMVVVVSERFEVFFDTLGSTRKAANLRRDPRCALVMGWEDRCTAQIEGQADEPTGADLARLKALYFERVPDGRERERWPGIAYFRVRPRWIRFSDFSAPQPRIVEFTAADLARG